MSLSTIMREQEFHSHPQSLLQDDNDTSAHQQQQQQSNTQSSSANQNAENSTQTNNVRRRYRTTTQADKRRTTKLSPNYTRPGRPKNAAMKELFYATTLYVTCIYLPYFPHYMYQIYRTISTYSSYIRERVLWTIWILWRFGLVIFDKLGWMDDPFNTVSQQHRTAEDGETGSSGSGMMKGESSSNGLRRFRIGRKISNYIFSTSTANLWEEFNQQHHQQTEVPDPSEPYTWGFGRSTTYFPAILMVLQDIQILLMMAVLLAIIRIWFVHMLVPDVLAPRRLEALTRCKSSHLLSSSSYSFGGVKGWDRTAERLGVQRTLSGRSNVANRSGTALNNIIGEDEGENNENRIPGYYDRLLMWISYHWYRLRPSIRRALGHEPSARYDGIIAASQQQQQQQLHPLPSSSPFRRSNTTPNPTQQLFSAPRYATACFRLLYTSISCLAALILFQSAEFWPRHVFGTHADASTTHCWDLSGSFSALGFLDDDYDAKNGALKYFFLAQAAYQLHSLCFHIVSMLLLLLYGGGGNSRNGGMSRTNSFIGQLSPFKRQSTKSNRLISMKTSMQSYFRPMVEHCIVLCCLVGAYLFSGLRRLGAVGIFTLELSSVFLQLLQVCIYAPENSRWRKPEVVIFVHRVLTIPTFVYCRLIVLPFILWRSALFESQEWLEQIEKVFSPGWAEKLYTLFNGSLCLIFALNLVLFRRLLFHPHLKQIRHLQHRRE